ncbi:MAG: hypothetical protein JJ879_14805 [Sneathiella sp.]|nr:hypothetical protein [Sneathiella sp.]
MVKGGGYSRLSVLMLIVFLMNALLPSISLAAFGPDKLGLIEGVSAEQSPFSNETVVICTPEGLKTVRWSDLENSYIEENDADNLKLRVSGCFLCSLPTFGTTVTIVLLIGLLDFASEKAEKEPFPTVQFAAPFHLIDPRTFVRGPPTSA